MYHEEVLAKQYGLYKFKTSIKMQHKIVSKILSYNDKFLRP